MLYSRVRKLCAAPKDIEERPLIALRLKRVDTLQERVRKLHPSRCRTLFEEQYSARRRTTAACCVGEVQAPTAAGSTPPPPYSPLQPPPTRDQKGYHDGRSSDIGKSPDRRRPGFDHAGAFIRPPPCPGMDWSTGTGLQALQRRRAAASAGSAPRRR
jgi:hypothetical protein